MISITIGKKNRKEAYESDYKSYVVADYGNKEIHAFYLMYFSKQNQVERYNYEHDTFYTIEQFEKKVHVIQLLGAMRFAKIIGMYNKALTAKLLNGETIRLGLGLNTINVHEIKPFRGLRKDGTVRKAVDWPMTRKNNERNAEGKLKLVFKTDELAYRITWHKNFSNVSNSSYYTFKPSAMLVKALFAKIRKEPMIIHNYRENSTYFKLPKK